MSSICKRLRKATVLRELIRGWRNGENVEFEDRMQIEDVDVFNIPVVGDSAVVDVPGGVSAVVDVPDGDSAVVDVSDGESAVVDVPNGERAIVDVSDVENAGVDVSDGESSVC
ncbi:sperm acrosomal protein fsa-acr.1 [Plakobranchus ocellatus]|uniref:Sperm acrosomal protein fsa-acr.1 n=1 Tax=Plakobranchus ocellatus TaxID=259542 RepID=A0AAV3ZRM5_9GAST|nr:sperm acrosomal protein fsa-acr.1 [Plakobranchus ocellatus]